VEGGRRVSRRLRSDLREGEAGMYWNCACGGADEVDGVDIGADVGG